MLAAFMDDIREGDLIQPRRLAERLRVPMTQLSKLVHVNRNALAARPDSPAVQQKLAKVAQIIARVAEITEDEGAAIIWFKYQPIAGFGWKTAEELVEQGHADAVMWHIDSVEAGGVA